MLSSHFTDSKYFLKNFADTEKGTTYVNRKDSSAMRTYIMEIACLTSCRKIVNYGGFINEESVADKIIEPTCHPRLFGLLRQSNTGAERGCHQFAIGNGEVELA